MPYRAPASSLRRLRVGALLLGLVGAGAGLASMAPLPGLRATLVDTSDRYRSAGREHWRWQTHWVVQWQPVPGAADYEIILMTSEGTSKKTTRVTQPPFRLEVAKGDNPRREGMPTRPIQLLTIQSLLSIKIVPRLPDGSAGPASPWLQVGSLYP